MKTDQNAPRVILLFSTLFALLILISPKLLTAQSTDTNFDGISESGIVLSHTIDASEQNYQPEGVVHTIPAPAGQSIGLTWDGSYLWVSDVSTDSIYKVNPDDGTIMYSFRVPGDTTMIEGLAWDGAFLWAAGWQNPNGEGSEIYKIDPSNGSVVFSFDYPGPEPWPHGITYDGQYLWADNFRFTGTNIIEKLDPATGDVISSFNAPSDKTVGLTWDGTGFWSSDFFQQLFFKLNKENGNVLAQVTAPDANLRDLTWDGEYLWVVAWDTKTIYQIDVESAGIDKAEPFIPTIASPNPFDSSVKITFELSNKSKVKLDILDVNGRVISNLLAKKLNNGIHHYVWNGKNSDGHSVHPGIYFYRISIDGFSATGKIVKR